MGCIWYTGQKHLMMDEFRPPQISRVKLTLNFVLLYHIHYHSTRAAYPLERDVAELTGVSPPKRWIPFMERLAKICLNEIKAKESMTFTDALKCMTIREKPYCSLKKNTWVCTLTHVYPNTLKVRGLGHRKVLPIQIIVHRQFILNITLKYGHPVDFEILRERYTEQNFSTIMILNNSVKMAFFYSKVYIFEYSIAQKLNALVYDRVRANVMIFFWGDFQVTYFQIKVDIRARLSLEKIICLFCKIIVYDGPNENLPIIAKIDNAHRFQRVVASTFQVFVAVIKNVPQDFLMTYKPIYITKGVFNLTEYDNIELSFDNNTSCYGHSWYARSCVYTFLTSTHKQIRFSLKKLQFMKSYRYTKSLAGIIIFNDFHGTTENMLELNNNLPGIIEIIGTGYIMHIMIFMYSIFESLTCAFEFSLSLSDCDVLLVSGNYISYSGHVTANDDTLRVFQMTHSLQTLLEYDRCLRLQFIDPSSEYKMIFPNSAPLLIVEDIIPLCPRCSLFTCEKSWEGPSHAEYDIRHDHMMIRTVDSFTIEPCWYNYVHIVIQWLQCKLPCQYIFNEKYCGPRFETSLIVYDANDNSSCDICKNAYIGCLPYAFPLATTVSYTLLIKSNMCLSGEVRIVHCTYVFPIVSLVFNTSMFKMPVFSSEVCAVMFGTMCNIEIPMVGVSSFSHWPDSESVWSARDVMDVYLDGVLYRRLSRLPVTWDTAALACQEIGASLLTIHSLTEYQFIKDTFLRTFDIAILYVGVKREVMRIICEYIALKMFIKQLSGTLYFFFMVGGDGVFDGLNAFV